MSTAVDQAHTAASEFKSVHAAIREQVCRVMVGQDDVIDGVLTALFAGGHVLLEGVPGLGKTMLVRALGRALNLKFSRIQFTPDMMPADIQGTHVLSDRGDGTQELTFQEGPLVANLILADEINRATPKTQSALLEAMQEGQISVGKRTITLEQPFVVMATQNPVEQEGTYPLPEAQLDRFLFKLIVGYPKEEEYREILKRTTGASEPEVNAVCDGETIMNMRKVVREVPVADAVQAYAVRLVLATQPSHGTAHEQVRKNVSLGSSPRGAQGLLLAAKVAALLDGRFAVSTDDIRAVARPVLRHRVLLNFGGQSEGLTSDAILEHVIAGVRAES